MSENNQQLMENSEQVEVEKPKELIEYTEIGDRLKEIEEKISGEDIDLDESLKLYEEAVNLGMKASQTIENNVMVNLDATSESNESKQD